jgi:hypothetical protein
MLSIANDHGLRFSLLYFPQSEVLGHIKSFDI